ncbi:MAG TPA: NERD domain-containing protein [Bacillus bacterium]|nr:NERD domain-containing protein [Bacillus sp. (in: firmicutes)]
MILKPRFESTELQLLRFLHSRAKLSDKDANQYFRLEKGYEGETKFDEWLKDLSDDWIVLNDLLFEINNTVFQIDSTLLSNEGTYLFEVKNYDDDYYIENEQWYSKSGKEITNPLHQLDRSETQFRRLLQELGYNPSKMQIKSYVVFVNHNFYLYQAPLNLPIIFPTQINRFMDKLNMKPTSKPRDSLTKLANQLLSKQLKESPYIRLLDYKYEQLRKGIICGSCQSIFSDSQTLSRLIVCSKCGCMENIDAAVLRSVEEYKLLFPERKITTNSIQEWCKIIKSKKTIRRILSTNFIPQGHGNATYYIHSKNSPSM